MRCFLGVLWISPAKGLMGDETDREAVAVGGDRIPVLFAAWPLLDAGCVSCQRVGRAGGWLAAISASARGILLGGYAGQVFGRPFGVFRRRWPYASLVAYTETGMAADRWGTGSGSWCRWRFPRWIGTPTFRLRGPLFFSMATIAAAELFSYPRRQLAVAGAAAVGLMGTADSAPPWPIWSVHQSDPLSTTCSWRLLVVAAGL